MTDQYAHDTTDFRIATSVLHDIVRGSLAGDSRLSVHHGGVMRGPDVEVQVEGDACSITVPVEARFGQDLQALGADIQDVVADAMRSMTGLRVEAVDVVFYAVHPPNGEE